MIFFFQNILLKIKNKDIKIDLKLKLGNNKGGICQHFSADINKDDSGSLFKWISFEQWINFE